MTPVVNPPVPQRSGADGRLRCESAVRCSVRAGRIGSIEAEDFEEGGQGELLRVQDGWDDGVFEPASEGFAAWAGFAVVGGAGGGAVRLRSLVT